LVTAVHETAPRASQGRFRLAVDRSFTLAGAGTVVTGTVLSGAVNIGDRVTVSPSGLSARVRSIHAQNRPAERGEAGQRCALNLAGDGITKDAIARGDVVLDSELHAPADRIDAILRVLPSEARPVTQWMPARLHHAAADVAARIVLLGDTPIAPGAEATVQIVLERPIAAAVNDRFVLRDTTAQRTIAGGRFLDLRAPARKRRAPERLAQLDACMIGQPERALIALLDRAPWYVDLDVFARDRALAAAEIDAMAARGDVIRIAGTSLGLAPAVWLRLKRALIATLEAFHAGNPDLAGMGFDASRACADTRGRARWRLGQVARA
jgi:selenocysteine-specific elongation factor